MALYTERRARIAVLPEWAGGTDFKIGAASSPGQPATTTPHRFPPHPQSVEPPPKGSASISYNKLEPYLACTYTYALSNCSAQEKSGAPAA
jgi:hypothetical protein